MVIICNFSPRWTTDGDAGSKSPACALEVLEGCVVAAKTSRMYSEMRKTEEEKSSQSLCYGSIADCVAKSLMNNRQT